MIEEGFYALVELLGHQKMVGFVKEVRFAAMSFLRIDSIPYDGMIGSSRLVSPNAIYAINPISKELATQLSKTYETAPVHTYDVPQLTGVIRAELERQRIAEENEEF